MSEFRLRDATAEELAAISNEAYSTQCFGITSTAAWADIQVGVALEGPYKGKLVGVENGRVTSTRSIPPAKNNG